VEWEQYTDQHGRRQMPLLDPLRISSGGSRKRNGWKRRCRRIRESSGRNTRTAGRGMCPKTGLGSGEGQQAACGEILPVEDRSLSHWPVTQMDEEQAHSQVLVQPAILDFLTTTDVGRRILDTAEEDSQSELSGGNLGKGRGRLRRCRRWRSWGMSFLRE